MHIHIQRPHIEYISFNVTNVQKHLLLEVICTIMFNDYMVLRF